MERHPRQGLPRLRHNLNASTGEDDGRTQKNSGPRSCRGNELLLRSETRTPGATSSRGSQLERVAGAPRRDGPRKRCAAGRPSSAGKGKNAE
ncbi:hypothetical protein NDU88_006950 [Pleurodeles waltl]|uniref:Uncharacterized protein n=1 Tax=Pleurodeles waltl TaxID=8319 RepID=A0AAV7QJ80_PLEWA|nr:hypothetical protein NDU88_006950 [Pleurodeles waltl]